ncbi:zinc finger protein VAR3, chloroplastic [Henckelia pumila]|uniref:zinc finger protein VAR3, chloroplastic n=1 Tax=Henckelia pumila TaxID=405737 RepID=UPI003C6E1C33
MAATSGFFTCFGTTMLRNSRNFSQIRSLKFFLPPSLRLNRYCSSSAALLGSNVSAYTADSPSTTSTHPWPEWVKFVDRLKAKGYLSPSLEAGVSEIGGVNDQGVVDYTDINLLKNACLSFARARYDIFKSLSTKDIQTIVESGCPNVLRKSVNSGKRLRAYLKLDEGDVCGSCNLRGSCDRAYILLDDSEGAPRTVDIVRMLIFYALDPLVISGDMKPPGRDLIEASAKKLLLELIDLGDTPIDPDIPNLVDVTPRQKKQSLNTFDRGSSQDVEMKPGDWVCTKCSFLNFARNTQCLKCKEKGLKHVSRDSSEMKKGDWNCPQCSFMNFASKKNCFRCQVPRPPRELKAGDWECPECDFHNFNRNDACKRCNLKRPNQESTTPYGDRTWKKPY